MDGYAQIRLYEAQEQIKHRHREAEQERLAPARVGRSIRRSLGFSIIRLGKRLAPDPYPLQQAHLR